MSRECGRDDRGGAVAALSDCGTLAFPGTVDAFAGEGDAPIVLVDVRTGVCPYAASLVAWYVDGSWSVQSLDDILGINAMAKPLRTQREPGGPSARLVAADETRLGLIHAVNACGSGAHEAYLLLELIDGRWVGVWDSNRTAISELSHTKIEFQGPGLDTVYVRGASWYMKDAKSRTFRESNAGPHRRFEQVWVREGNEYQMQSARVVPSPYNTLVEFVYALRTDDEQTAASLVTDASLVDRARSLGLVQGYDGWCAQYGDREPPCVVVRPDYSGARVEMAPDGEDWLISGIEPCTYRYDSTGGHCD